VILVEAWRAGTAAPPTLRLEATCAWTPAAGELFQ
jgi:hypothetical protein